MSKAQTQKAASILKALGEEWRELVAGREGFLTEPRRAGLLRHKVVWGEMDSMVCLYPESPFLCFGEGWKVIENERRKLISLEIQGHVNNVTYARYAETARVNWAYNYAVHIDPKNKKSWSELLTPNGDGLILRSIRIDYKFVRQPLSPSCSLTLTKGNSP